MSTFVKTVPLLVEDSSLSRSTTIDPISGEPALRVTGDLSVTPTDTAWTPAQAVSVTNAVGETTDPDTTTTVIGLLKSIITHLS